MHRFNSKVKLGERIALLLSLIALSISAVAILQTSKSNSMEKQQVELAFQVATSNALIQEQSEKQGDFQQSLNSTQVAVNEYQKNLQSTQTALDLEFRSIMRQQAFPYVKAINPDYVIRFSEIKCQEDNGLWTIEGIGTIDFNIANDGGGQAGWWKSDWKTELLQDNIHLRILDIKQSNDDLVNLPYNIPGQYTVGLKMNLGSQLTTDALLCNQTDYQLGRLMIQELQNAKTYINFEFSNTDLLRIQINGYELNMPVVSIDPNPPSPFPVTNADELGRICFTFREETDGVYAGEISSYFSKQSQNTEDASSGELNIKSGTCYSFSVGKYDLHWSSTKPIEQSGEVSFNVTAEEEKEVVAVIPKATLISKVTTWIVQNKTMASPIGFFAIGASVLMILNFSTKRTYVFSIIDLDNPMNVLQKSIVAFYWLNNSREVKVGYKTLERYPGSAFLIRRIGFDDNKRPKFQVDYIYHREKQTTKVLFDDITVIRPGLGVRITGSGVKNEF